jgi:hypothetical protein
MANLCHPHEMTELVDRFQNWRGFECPYCKIAELEKANREFALNEAKMRTGWWIQNYQELHAKVAARDAVLSKIVETAQEHPAKANFVAVHRQIIGEARQFLTSHSGGEKHGG